VSGAGVEARHSSDSSEHYSPHDVLVLVREVLDGIDLDPASCATANRTVRADRIFTKADNGLAKPWRGRVFVNCPGGRCDADGHEVHRKTKQRRPCTETGSCGIPAPHVHTGVTSAQKRWWFKLAAEYVAGNVDSAIWLGFSVESLQTTQVGRPRVGGALLPSPHAFPICFPAGRIAYVRAIDSEDPGAPSLFAAEELLGEGGDSPPHSSYLCFLPPRTSTGLAIARAVDRFEAVFSAALGAVNVPRSLILAGGLSCTSSSPATI
jgi:hypothetical protein